VNPAAIYDMQLGIPGSTAASYTYNYCITAVKPILGPATAPTACGTLAAYGNPVCGAQDLLGEVGAYGVQNNINGTTGQCVQAMAGGTCGGFSVSFNGTFGNAGSNSPFSYPSSIYGWQAGSFYGPYRTAKQLSAINSIPTIWTFTTPSGGKWDASYDIWFSPQAAPATANGGLELMIWPNYGGGAQPSGTMVGTKTIGTTGTWEVWVNHMLTVGANSWQYIAYRKNPGSSVTLNFNIKDFATDAINNEGVGITTGWYFLGAQAGFEVWNESQGATMSTSSFTAAVN
jgi:cellulose 1,4-beta-cellobiosidase